MYAQQSKKLYDEDTSNYFQNIDVLLQQSSANVDLFAQWFAKKQIDSILTIVDNILLDTVGIRKIKKLLRKAYHKSRAWETQVNYSGSGVNRINGIVSITRILRYYIDRKHKQYEILLTFNEIQKVELIKNIEFRESSDLLLRNYRHEQTTLLRSHHNMDGQ